MRATALVAALALTVLLSLGAGPACGPDGGGITICDVPSVDGTRAKPDLYVKTTIGNFDAEWHSAGDYKPWITDGVIPYSDIARLDYKINQPTMLEEKNGITGYDIWYGYTDSIRAYNPDHIVLTYIYCFGFHKSWNQPWAADRLYGELFRMCENNDFFTMSVAPVDTVDCGPSFPSYWLFNFMGTDAADSLAEFWARHWAESDNSRDYTGVFTDYYDYPDFKDWQCGTGSNCGDVVDFDNDGTAYSSDPDEQAAYRQFQVDFFTKLRAYMEQYHGNNKVIIVSNGDTGMSSVTAPLLDGMMFEVMENGLVISNHDMKADLVDGTYEGRFSSAVLEPALLITDIMEWNDTGWQTSWCLAAVTYGGAGTAFDPAYVGKRTHYGWPGLTWDLGEPTGMGTIHATLDTLTREFENGRVQIVFDSAYPFPYRVSDGVGGTIVSGGGW